MESCAPRMARQSKEESVLKSIFLNRTVPSDQAIGGAGKRSIMVKAVTLLPHPDSPTRATRSPGAKSKSSPRKTHPSFPVSLFRMETFKFLTESKEDTRDSLGRDKFSF